jgi:hypothetical protein
MATEAQCVLALDEHEETLTRRKNVVGLGVVPLDETEGVKGGMAVAVYVENSAAKGDVPETLAVHKGKRVLQVPTRVIEQGKVVLERLP